MNPDLVLDAGSLGYLDLFVGTCAYADCKCVRAGLQYVAILVEISDSSFELSDGSCLSYDICKLESVAVLIMLEIGIISSSLNYVSWCYWITGRDEE